MQWKTFEKIAGAQKQFQSRPVAGQKLINQTKSGNNEFVKNSKWGKQLSESESRRKASWEKPVEMQAARREVVFYGACAAARVQSL